MGVNQGIGTVTANISGQVQSGIPTGATQVRGSAGANNNTATVYTVTAGKTLYLTSMSISGTSTGATLVDVTVTFDYGAGDVQVYDMRLQGIATYQNACQNVGIYLGGLVAIPATKLIKVTTNNAVCYGTCSITGFEL